MKAFIAFLALLMVFTACSKSFEAGGGRVVVVYMRDNHFEPDRLDVRRGATVVFSFVNNGTVAHDAFISDAAAQADHEKKMRSSGAHDMHMQDAGAITVAPGKTGRLTHTFDQSGTTLIGCHEPGHYAAGMVVKVKVQ